MGLVEADHLLHGEDAERADEPLPKVGRMQNATQPKGKIEEMSPVEDLQIKTLVKSLWSEKSDSNCQG